MIKVGTKYKYLSEHNCEYHKIISNDPDNYSYVRFCKILNNNGISNIDYFMSEYNNNCIEIISIPASTCEKCKEHLK